MKKIIAIILTMLIVAPLSTLPISAQYFSDVNISHWARESINFAADNGYIDPVSTYTFNPDGDFTRADVAKMIYRFKGLPQLQPQHSLRMFLQAHPMQRQYRGCLPMV